MRFLTPPEWQSWCAECHVPLITNGWAHPSFPSEQYQIVDVPYPVDSGEKVSMARFLLSLIESQQETLLVICDWAVWPSSQHMPLFTRFREAFGERRPLIEANGHLLSHSESDDAVSIIATSMLFFWDCYGISATGRDAFYFSHDEYCYFGSRDAAVAANVRQRLQTDVP